MQKEEDESLNVSSSSTEAERENDEENDQANSDDDEFWFKAGQTSTNRQSNSLSPTTMTENDENSNISIGKMANLIKKTLKFDDDNQKNDGEKCSFSKIEYIGGVTKRFVDINDAFSTEMFKLLTCLCYLCDDGDERCVLCFMQQKNSLKRLNDVLRDYSTTKFYWKKYKLDPKKSALVDAVVELCLRLLTNLSRCNSSDGYVHNSQLPSTIVTFFDPFNAFFSDGVDFFSDEKFDLNLSKVKIEESLPFLRRALPVASFPVDVYHFDSDSSKKFIDPTRIWPYPTSSSSDLKTVEKKSSVCIVDVVDACTFWAVDVTHQKRIVLDVITSCGRQSVVKLGFCRNLPSIGEIYLSTDVDDASIKKKIASAPFFRCVVVERVDFENVVVFAMDFGFFVKISYKKLRNLDETIKLLTGAAFLLIIKDYVPAPKAIILRHLFATVTNFGRHPFIAECFSTNDFQRSLSNVVLRRPLDSRREVFRNFWLCSESLSKTDCLPVLLNLLKLPLVNFAEVLTNVLKICVQFSAHCRVRQKLNDSKMVPTLLALSSKIVDWNDASEEKKISLLLPLVKCLSNLCLGTNDGRKDFEKCNGLILPMTLIKIYPETDEIYRAADVLLKNVTTEIVTKDSFDEFVEKLYRQQISSNESEYLAKFLNDTVQLKNSCPKRIKFDEKFLQKYYLPLDFKDSLEKRRNQILQPSEDVEKILRRIAVPPKRGRFYVKNSYFQTTKCDDADDDGPLWEFFSETTNLTDVKAHVVQELACAALNGRFRLTIYFGLAKSTTNEKQIKGVNATLLARDSFRVGLDFTLSRAFRPILQPNMYEIEFVPVYAGGKERLTPIDDCFVVEIKILHVATDVYQLEESGKIYVKQNDLAYELTMNEAHDFFAEQLELDEKRKIEQLEKDIVLLETVLKKAAE